MQINIEYNISYIYHSLYAFFDRDNIGLPGTTSLCNMLFIGKGVSVCIVILISPQGRDDPYPWACSC